MNASPHSQSDSRLLTGAASASGDVIVLPRKRLFSALEMHAFVLGSVAAAVLLIGWGIDIDAVKRIVPGFPTMKVFTAASFMLLSMSCLLSLRVSRRSHFGAIALATVVLIGVFAVHVFDPDRMWDDTWRQVPSEVTLICLGLGAAAMLVIMLAPHRRLLAAALALTGATPALYRILAMALFAGAPDSQGSPMDTMALHTAILTVWFMTACVLMHPRLGLADLFFQSSLRGRILRRAAPFIILTPVVAGALSLTVHYVAGWPDEILYALTATISVLFGVGILWWLSSLVAEWQSDANEHANRLERANEALEQYASSAAHDLKAPVRHVLLYSELLQEAIERGDKESQRKHVASVRAAGAELPGLIDGLLEYSRSAYSQLRPGDYRLSELVQAAATLHQVDLRAAGAKVRILREGMLWCDAQLMSVVFQNLISNSLKNRRADRPLEIRVDAELTDDRWLVSVEDNGMGFDPDFAVVAFNPLARGARLAGDGSGIGLATCRTIVMSHGGEIRVDPAFRGGARIEITLPAKPEA